MSEIGDLKTAIPEKQFNNISSFFRPGLTDSSKLVLGDPYIKFTAPDGNNYYTRNFNHSLLIPTKKYLKYVNQFVSEVDNERFRMPIIEKTAVDGGKLVGNVDAQVRIDPSDGKNKLLVESINITHSKKYGTTFASDKKNQGLKTDIGRTLLTQLVAKLPFIDDVGGFRVSGARAKAAEQQGKRILSDKGRMTVGSNAVSRIKEGLIRNNIIDNFFSQLDLSKEKVSNYLKKNNRAVAGVALSGNDPMQSLGVKGVGKAIDDPANFYLALAEGGFVEEINFGDMVEFVPEQKRTVVDMDYLTRPL